MDQFEFLILYSEIGARRPQNTGRISLKLLKSKLAAFFAGCKTIKVAEQFKGSHAFLA